jgi:beta-1,4-mannosyl-glycoprotein beta-1,4-N-acetylglucosaminyltransferase
LPYKYPNIDYSKNQQWINENFQRNSIDVGLSKIQLNNKDVIISGDIDELPDINLLKSIKNNFIKIDDI